jgi:phosphate/sulfate permease
MRFIGGIIGGVVAGLLGAIIWTLIAYFAHVQLGIIAWLIGGMVGVGVALGCKKDTGSETGALAAIIAVLAILGGKYATAWAYVRSDPVPHVAFTDNDAKVYTAHEVVAEFEEASKTLKWPEGQNDDIADEESHFPKDVWKEAVGRWDAKSSEEQATFKAERDAEFRALVSAMEKKFVNAAFKQSFSVLSFVFIAFALFTAFKVGGGMSGDD